MWPIQFSLHENSRLQPHTARLSGEWEACRPSPNLTWADQTTCSLLHLPLQSGGIVELGVGSNLRQTPWLRMREGCLPKENWRYCSRQQDEWMLGSECRCRLSAGHVHGLPLCSRLLGCDKPFLAALHTCGNP